MALLDWDFTNGLADSSAVSGQICTDGTYVWYVARNSAHTWNRLYRFRHSDKQYIKPDGSVGDPAVDAFQSLTARDFDTGIATDGTYVLIANDWETRAYLCSDMSFVADVTGSSPGNGFSAAGRIAAFDGTYFWTTGQGPHYLNRITPGTWAATSYDPDGNMHQGVIWDGVYLWLISGAYSSSELGVKVNSSGVKQYAVSSGGATVQSIFGAYDSIRGEMWFTGVGAGDGFESCRVRSSDGAFIDKVGAVVANFAAAKINPANYPNDSYIPGGGGCLVIGNYFFVGGSGNGSGTGYNSIQRRNVTTGNGAGAWPNSMPSNVGGFALISNTLYASFGSLGSAWGWMGLGYTDVGVTGANLTGVAPGTGPHISLTFDGPVGITGPTIGGPSDGLGVTGVTQISATQIDLACAIRPDHPDGDADNATLIPPIGEADPLGPPVPTGVGATVI